MKLILCTIVSLATISVTSLIAAAWYCQAVTARNAMQAGLVQVNEGDGPIWTTKEIAADITSRTSHRTITVW